MVIDSNLKILPCWWCTNWWELLGSNDYI